jgi:AcrR family transcriptional regulator
LFAERGFRATTVRDIADAAGILSGSLYHHFDSKESMIDELLRGFQDELFDRYREIMAQDIGPREKLQAVVVASFGGAATALAVVENYRERQNFTLETNVKSVFLVCRAAIRRMLEQPVAASRSTQPHGGDRLARADQLAPALGQKLHAPGEPSGSTRTRSNCGTTMSSSTASSAATSPSSETGSSSACGLAAGSSSASGRVGGSGSEASTGVSSCRYGSRAPVT